VKFQLSILLVLFAISASSSAGTPAVVSPAPSLTSDFISPVTQSMARTILLTGGLLTLFLVLDRDQISDPLQTRIDEERPLGKFAVVGDQYGRTFQNAAYVLGMLAHGHFAKSSRSYQLARIMTEATLYSGMWSTALKYTVREKRPDNPTNRVSFPSGHSTMAMAFAAVIGANHGWKWGVPAYLLAGLTMASRMNDNQHYLHDVIAGATIGVAYGLGVSLNQRPVSETGLSWQIIPSMEPGRYGLMGRFAW